MISRYDDDDNNNKITRAVRAISAGLRFTCRPVRCTTLQADKPANDRLNALAPHQCTLPCLSQLATRTQNTHTPLQCAFHCLADAMHTRTHTTHSYTNVCVQHTVFPSTPPPSSPPPLLAMPKTHKRELTINNNINSRKYYSRKIFFSSNIPQTNNGRLIITHRSFIRYCTIVTAHRELFTTNETRSGSSSNQHA